MGVTEILCSLRLGLERKAVREIPESSRKEFFFQKKKALSDAEDNTSGLLNKRGIADWGISLIER